jgi:hypothetical protein
LTTLRDAVQLLKKRKAAARSASRQRVGAGLYGATEAPVAIDTSNINAVSTLRNDFHRGETPFLEQQETGRGGTR